MDTELWKLSALELAAAVVSGEVSAVEVVDGHLERIAAVNPTVNAVTNLLADSAREAAKGLTAAAPAVSPLADWPGCRSPSRRTSTSPARRPPTACPRFATPWRPSTRPRCSGCAGPPRLPIGRANMPDLALRGPHTASQLYGDTVNPWDASRTPGGTSGGDGVGSYEVDLAPVVYGPLTGWLSPAVPETAETAAA